MNLFFSRLSDHTLKLVAEGLRSGRITLPSSSLQISRLVPGDAREAVVSGLGMLAEQAFKAEQVAMLLDAILDTSYTRFPNYQSF